MSRPDLPPHDSGPKMSTDATFPFEACIDLTGRTPLGEVTKALPAGAGVCLLAGPENQPVLLIQGAHLRQLVRNRLQADAQDTPTRRARLRPVTRSLWFRRTYSAFETRLAYWYLARAVYPESYREWFARVRVWFLHVDPEQARPRLTVVDTWQPAGRYWGPFAEKTAARRYLETIEDLFDLCRWGERGEETCDPAGCAYAQMERCGAVRNGVFDPQTYRRLLGEAAAFLSQPGPVRRALWQEEMKRCAAARQFEQAGRIKQRLAAAETLEAPAYRWVRPLEHFRVVSFQPGPRLRLPDERRRTAPGVTPFLIGPGWVERYEPFLPDQAEPLCRRLLEEALPRRDQDRLDPLRRENANVELLAWVAQFLYKSDDRQGLYLPLDETTTPADLARQVREHFTAPRGARKRPDSSRTGTAMKKPRLDAYSLSERQNDTGETN